MTASGSRRQQDVEVIVAGRGRRVKPSRPGRRARMEFSIPFYFRLGVLKMSSIEADPSWGVPMPRAPRPPRKLSPLRVFADADAGGDRHVVRLRVSGWPLRIYAWTAGGSEPSLPGDAIVAATPAGCLVAVTWGG